jgi:hypothetical protein
MVNAVTVSGRSFAEEVEALLAWLRECHPDDQRWERIEAIEVIEVEGSIGRPRDRAGGLIEMAATVAAQAGQVECR